MRKAWLFLITISFFVLLAACSGDEESAKMSSEDRASDSAEFKSEEESVEAEVEQESATGDIEAPNTRMIIHQARISTNVKDLEKAQHNMEQKVKKYDGYVVESNVYLESDETSSGKMVVRIPEKHFETFLSEAEAEASKVLEKNVTGQDVTEQYVDLSSRVKSKRAVEERLLAFMKDAQKTEDLLKISTDLAKIQEEIEVLVGKINYLENQTSFSTIELTMHEKRVIIPEIENKDLNTWEKTKKQFITSTNSLLSVGSGIIVFVIGNLPVLVLLGVIIVVVVWIIKRRKVRG
ncbi:DUF4349 domain-containing protein [Psychrobacillus psychrodurans]|uniref:DUF4349 domain-containing protein n=1 Tax=Psychrobacillus TaxID=1221880 RepID=UPI0008F0CE45|nr:DUF4349 domain-containing protein [Psychrobacillus psychrodurans]MCK1996902.1 DUF4349 domain-containing protein [Psychrobacillus psychrodurans]MCZ8538771.1 DUF4349 domain-containing protein [Psychrobacillus psychrodurans]SFM21549.1 protein of unknown function [Psychrobacillus psychrodurans]